MENPSWVNLNYVYFQKNLKNRRNLKTQGKRNLKNPRSYLLSKNHCVRSPEGIKFSIIEGGERIWIVTHFCSFTSFMMYMKKFFDFDWLKSVQFQGNSVEKKQYSNLHWITFLTLLLFSCVLSVGNCVISRVIWTNTHSWVFRRLLLRTCAISLTWQSLLSYMRCTSYVQWMWHGSYSHCKLSENVAKWLSFWTKAFLLIVIRVVKWKLVSQKVSTFSPLCIRCTCYALCAIVDSTCTCKLDLYTNGLCKFSHSNIHTVYPLFSPLVLIFALFLDWGLNRRGLNKFLCSLEFIIIYIYIYNSQ